jgi:Ca2+-transporting ATPase
MEWYSYTQSQLESKLKTNFQTGLLESEAKQRLVKFGLNVLPEKKSDSWLFLFFQQFRSPLIYILLFCSMAVYAMGEESDSIIILVVLVFNAIIGTVQEGKNQNTLKSLKKLSQAEAEVVRGGQEIIVSEAEVVPGDILVLQEGQKVVADSRVLFVSNLTVDEAALTGESGAVRKISDVLTGLNFSASSQQNMIFKGTSIVSGNGRAIVVGTGQNTEIGKISLAVANSETEIPLQKNIRRLANVIIFAIGLMSVGIFFLGLATGRGAVEMFSVVVSLAVSMIPEGLPLVLTLILVSGVWRMSKRKALVKKMQAVEALGQAKILAVDKTGTITKNEMVVKKVFIMDSIYSVAGNGYEPKGGIRSGEKFVPINIDLEMTAKIASLSSRGLAVFKESEGVYKVSGDPTEAAMSVLGDKIGFAREHLREQYAEVGEIPFDYKTKFRAIFYKVSGDGIFCAISGAPEVLLEKAEKYLKNGHSHKMTEEVRKIFLNTLEDFSAEGLRVVAFGFKNLLSSHPLDNIDNLELAGFFAIEDSVRPQAKAALTIAQSSGIKVVMITGDHKVTAKAIAKEAGIFKEGDEIITGTELVSMSATELSLKLKKVSVFARVTPEDKMKIIAAYRNSGLIVAMTGDGVNDAPSLVAADLGVAMGKIGTEVAREAADIVLLDDNLSSIISAIEEGRAMYKNIQKALLFLFSTSLGEMLTVVLALVLGLPLPVLAVQILWLNLITDPLIGSALALEEKEEGLLVKPFEKPPKYFINREMLIQMILVAVVMAVVTLYLFKIYLAFNYSLALTVSLTTLAVLQWYNGFNCHFMSSGSVFSKKIFSNGYLWLSLVVNFMLQLLAIYNPFFQKFLKTTPMGFSEWILVLSFSLSVILVEELRKVIYKFFVKVR